MLASFLPRSLPLPEDGSGKYIQNLNFLRGTKLTFQKAVFIKKHHHENLGSEDSVSSFIKNILWWLGYGVDNRGFFHIVWGGYPASYPLDSGEFFIWTKAFGAWSFVQRIDVDLDLHSTLLEHRDDCIFYNIAADL
jgi:hypothetical protein